MNIQVKSILPFVSILISAILFSYTYDLEQRIGNVREQIEHSRNLINVNFSNL